MAHVCKEAAVRMVLNRIEAAWQLKHFDDLEQCFDEAAVIVGPNYQQYAAGQKECANSYREFATNAAVIEYEESDQHPHLAGYSGLHIHVEDDLQPRKGSKEGSRNGPDRSRSRWRGMARLVPLHLFHAVDLRELGPYYLCFRFFEADVRVGPLRVERRL